MTYGCVVGPINWTMAHSKNAKKFALNSHHYGLTTAVTIIVTLKAATTAQMTNRVYSNTSLISITLQCQRKINANAL